MANTLRFGRAELRALTLAELAFWTQAQCDYSAEMDHQQSLIS
ncbi:hypothetical protein [Saccharibacter floricola]|nr:hypothetical protein [Saccharibacter floricola]